MNTFKKKLISTICMVAFSICFVIAQTNTIKHSVDRGETLTSIAKHYETTENKIIELNPDAAQFIYVGMELAIPVEKVVNIVKEEEPLQNVLAKSNSSNQIIEVREVKSKSFQKWNCTMNISCGLIPKPKGADISGSSFTLTYSLGANYNISKSLFAGARVGYLYSNYMSLSKVSSEYLNIDTNNHMISIPIELGYKFHLITDKLELIPYAGIDINCIVKSTTESDFGGDKKKKSNKPDDRLNFNGRIGLRLNLWGIYLGGSYVIPFDNTYGKNNGFPEISLGWTI